MSSQLFPLPLTLWEEFFVVDDHENYPANFMTRIRCRGRLSRDLLLEALANCEKSHPLFGAQILRRGRKLYWVPTNQKELPVQFLTSDVEPQMPLMTKMNVEAGRIWSVSVIDWNDVEKEHYTDIIVQLHHALCDGLGAIQFISDVAKEIHDLHSEKLANEPVRLRDANTDLESLKTRGKFPQSWSHFFKTLPYHYLTVYASIRLIFTKVAPLIPVDSVSDLLSRPKEFLGYHKIELSTRDSSKLRRHCRKQNTTVNSILTAELFRAVHDWKLANQDSDFQSLRIIMPFNERTIQDKKLPACNRVSLSPFTRTKREIIDGEKLLAKIEKGVRAVKRAKLGKNFHRGLWLCKNFFGGLKRLAKTDRVGATCMFANVGNIQAHLGLPIENDLMKCGPVLIEDIDLIPPIRIGTSFGLTMHEFDGATRMGIHYDSAMADRAEFESFFHYLQERITQLAQTPV